MFFKAYLILNLGLFPVGLGVSRCFHGCGSLQFANCEPGSKKNAGFPRRFSFAPLLFCLAYSIASYSGRVRNSG